MVVKQTNPSTPILGIIGVLRQQKVNEKCKGEVTPIAYP